MKIGEVTFSVPTLGTVRFADLDISKDELEELIRVIKDLAEASA